jgi:hypothetical protein
MERLSSTPKGRATPTGLIVKQRAEAALVQFTQLRLPLLARLRSDVD